MRKPQQVGLQEILQEDILQLRQQGKEWQTSQGQIGQQL